MKKRDSHSIQLSQADANYLECVFRREAKDWQAVAEIWACCEGDRVEDLRLCTSSLSHISHALADRCWEISKYGHDVMEGSDRISLQSAIRLHDEYRNTWRQLICSHFTHKGA